MTASTPPTAGFWRLRVLGVTFAALTLVTGAGSQTEAADGSPGSLANSPITGSGIGCGTVIDSPDAVASVLVSRVNVDRVAIGLKPLVWNPQLFCLAQEWSITQGDAGTINHRDLTAVLRSPAYQKYRTLGENLLRGPAYINADQMHEAWMESPTHRENVLKPAYTSIGIALTYTSDGRVFATENFAA